MKKLEVYIDEKSESKILRPIRNKKDIIIVLAKAMKFFKIGLLIPEEKRKGKITITIGKLSRINFILEDSIISFNFPFNIKTWGDDIYEFAWNDRIIDSKITSEILSIFDEKEFKFQDIEFYEFYDLLDDQGDSDNLFQMLLYLLTFEDGYLRFDYDDEKPDEIYHPLTHVDINYSGKCTYKIGTNKKMTEDEFSILINNDYPRYYLRNGIA